MPRDKADSYNDRPVEELLRNLTSWSPVVRERAAIALATKPDDAGLVDRLVELAEDGGNPHGQLGACAAFEQLRGRGSRGVPALVALLDDEDYWLQAQAAEALAGIGEPARVAVPKLLERVAAPPRPEDRRAYLQRYLAFALFNRREGLLGKSIENVDRDQLRAAAMAVLQNEDGRARGSLRTVYDQLSAAEIEPMLPAIHEAVVNQSPSGVMFSDGIRLAGLGVLAEHRITEGVSLCLELIEVDRWGASRRMEGCLEALRKYGAAAKPVLPEIRAFAKELYEHPKFRISEPGARGHNEGMAKRYAILEEVIAEIESSEPGVPLRPLASVR